jgi:serine/threonine protein kinase
MGSDPEDPDASAKRTVVNGEEGSARRADDDGAPTVPPTPPTETVDLGPGQAPHLIAGRYRVERKLSEGGIGVVYRAIDERMDGRPVVIKVLLESSTGSTWLRRKFEDERRALVRLNDPNIVVAFDAGTLPNGQAFLVMELIAGGPLRDRLRAGPLSFETTADVVSQIGRALTAAHGRGIHHRDLKPENVMVQDLGDGRPLVKIIDFGIATVKESEDASTHMTQVAGTLLYMAPEQLEGKPGAASDTYALAVMTYEMRTGAVPFKSGNAIDLHARQREGVKVVPSALRAGLTPAVDAAILRGLSFRAADRPASAQQFASDLSRALARAAPRALNPDDIVTQPPTPMETRPNTRPDVPPTPGPAPPPPKPKTYLPWIGGALLVAGGVYYRMQMQAPTPLVTAPSTATPVAGAAVQPSPTMQATPVPTVVAAVLTPAPEAAKSRTAVPTADTRAATAPPRPVEVKPTEPPKAETPVVAAATAAPTPSPTAEPAQIAGPSRVATPAVGGADETVASPADRNAILDLVQKSYPAAMATRKATSVRNVFPFFPADAASALASHKKLSVRFPSCSEPAMQGMATATLSCKRVYEGTMTDGHVETYNDTAIFFLTKDEKGLWKIGALSIK